MNDRFDFDRVARVPAEADNVAIATRRLEAGTLVADGDGRFEGSVSGGCSEGAVIEEARKVMGSGDKSVLEFGVSNEQAWEVGLACGGTVRVLVERVV
jgi:xanthine/CO dehydrogenase XdhC/CoxF family maturation factor